MSKVVSKEPVVKMEGELKDKYKKMDNVVLDLEKKFGKGCVMCLA